MDLINDNDFTIELVFDWFNIYIFTKGYWSCCL